ncbi:MAG: ParB N-terminal domain-containing protein, partial [Anaerolineales bacterium]|nr:ParB N-terminal domain-containing protein [Anaerolineales bacterium]
MLKSDYVKALDDYNKARRSAAFQELLARLTGNPEDVKLFSYEEVRQQMSAIEKSAERLAEIPLDAIVGSVGRYHDFTRKFLPKASISQDRWARVMATTKGLSGLPPIDVYKIGEVYFVRDGNHRVSVAKQMGNTSIQAYITEVESRVNLPQDIKTDDLIIKAEYVKFLERTKLDNLKPGVDLNATKPGAYPTLLEHIEVHRHYMGIEQQREIPYSESALHWYEEIFSPVVNIIRRRGMLRDFPERTETDLYLWAANHRGALEQEVGWDIGSEAALSDLTEKHSPLRRKPIREFLSRLLAKIIPDVLEGGPPPGTWRKKLIDFTVLKYLFSDLLLALDDTQNTWNALDQAILIARLENSRIHGIHIHPEITDNSQKDHHDLREEFETRCLNAGINRFDFIVSEGDIGKSLVDHAQFVDLVILPLNHPPGDNPINRLESGLSTLIRSCPVPILTVPGQITQLNNILLAYDGSIKAKEALYIAAYLGSQRQSSLKIITSAAGLDDPVKVQKEAKAYLSRFPIESQYLITQSSIPDEV